MATVVALASGGFVGLSASTANAAGCYGLGCMGHDPIAYSCNETSHKDANLVVNNVTLATLSDRYSSGCNSNWASATLSNAAHSLGYRLDVSIQVGDTTGQEEVMAYPGPNNTGQRYETCSGTVIQCSTTSWGWPWTDMVEGTKVTQAFVDVYDANGNFIGNQMVQL